jgi:hypothetical protein
MLYSMEYLEANFEWREERLKEWDQRHRFCSIYQVRELSTNHDSVNNVMQKLVKSGLRDLCHDSTAFFVDR